MGDRLRRGIAAGNQGGEPFRLVDRCLCPFLLAFGAGVGEINVFPDPYLGRDHHQCASDVPSNLHHGCATDGTVQFVSRDAVFHYLHRHIVRQTLLQPGGAPGMGGYPRLY